MLPGTGNPRRIDRGGGSLSTTALRTVETDAEISQINPWPAGRFTHDRSTTAVPGAGVGRLPRPLPLLLRLHANLRPPRRVRPRPPLRSAAQERRAAGAVGRHPRPHSAG